MNTLKIGIDVDLTFVDSGTPWIEWLEKVYGVKMDLSLPPPNPQGMLYYNVSKYFPPAKASRLRDQIHSFRMEPDEPYHLAWERFQTLLSRCSQHGLSDWALVENFIMVLPLNARPDSTHPQEAT